jgi:hypothetical protein
VDLPEPSVDGRVAGDQAVDVGEPEEPTNGVHHRDHGGVDESTGAEVADVELDVCSLDPHEWVQAVVLAPGEPATQLKGVQDVGVARVARKVRDSSELGG